MKNKREKNSSKKDNTERKSIRKRLLSRMLITITASLVVLGGASSYMTYKSTVASLNQTMNETVKVSALTVTRELEGYERLAAELAYNPVFLAKERSTEQLKAECDQIAERNGVASVGITDAEGTALLSGDNVSDREYFKVPGQTGKTYVSDPLIRKDTGEMNVFISAPIMKADQFAGVVYVAVDAEVLCNIVKGIQIGETGNASMINGKGETIGYSDVNLVLEAYNTQKEVENDPDLAQLAEIERKLTAGEKGFGEYSYGGVEKYVAYAPVDGTPGWGMYVAVQKKEFLNSMYIGIMVVIALLVVALVITSIIVCKVASGIVNPLRLCAQRIHLLSEGDIHSPVPVIRTEDEIQTLADSMGILTDIVKKVMEDVDYCMKEMAAGNFRVISKARDKYVGDFENILLSERALKKTLGVTIQQVKDASDQVSMGAEQVASGAQALSQGTTEQAASVEQLSATINEIADYIKNNAENAVHTKTLSVQSFSALSEGKEKMEEMMDAIGQISAASGEIGKIIKAIDDIAFQTNILALNAAVEAARAGSAGKGFAVVADEVRNLAQKSAEAAKSTTELIEGSVRAVDNGARIANETKESIISAVESTNQVASVVSQIAEDSTSQAQSISQVTLGVEQISAVVQTNSATAEQSAAASEEMSAQAQGLKGLTAKFQCEEQTQGQL